MGEPSPLVGQDPPAVWEKACDCTDTSASGPWIVTDPGVSQVDGKYIVTVQLAWIACDRCDKPWVRIPDPQQSPQGDSHE